MFLQSYKEKPDSLLLQFRGPSRSVKDTFTEARLAARQIYQKSLELGLPIQICISGGIDSEATAEAFLAEGIPFQTITMRFNDGWNDFDIAPAIEFCKLHNLDQKFYDLDIIRFLETDLYLEYAHKYNCNSYQLCAHLWLLDQLEGIPVLGGQQFLPIFKLINGKIEASAAGQIDLLKVIGLSGHRHMSYYRYAKKNNRFLVSEFMQYTPELVMAFLRLPMYQEFISRGTDLENVNLTYTQKCLWYEQAGFKAKAKQAKFTGFEKLQNYYAAKFDKTWAINDLFRLPLEAKIPDKKTFVKIPHFAELTSLLPQILQQQTASSLNRRSFFSSSLKLLGLAGVTLFVPQIVWACCADSDCKAPDTCSGQGSLYINGNTVIGCGTAGICGP